jgi:hypothetical protein
MLLLKLIDRMFQKRFDTVGARSGASLTLTSCVCICQGSTLINYQLQTDGYQQLVDKNLVLSTVC